MKEGMTVTRRLQWLCLLWSALWWAGCGGVEATGPEEQEARSAQAVVAESCKAESLSWTSSPESSACAGPQELQFKCFNWRDTNDSHCPVKEPKTCYEPCEQQVGYDSQSFSVSIPQVYLYSNTVCTCADYQCEYITCYDEPVYGDAYTCEQAAISHASQMDYGVTYEVIRPGTYCIYRLDNIPVYDTVYDDPRCPAYDCSTHLACRHPSFGEAPAGACGNDTGPFYSAPGRSVAQLRTDPQLVQDWNELNVAQVPVEFASATCLTCEQESEPSRKYTCLKTQFERLGSLPLSAENLANLEQKLVHHMKLLLETRADKLTAEQRNHARSLYTSRPSLTSQCGTAWTAPAVSSSCFVPPELTGALTMCNQMRSEHVPAAALPAVFDTCFPFTAQLISRLPPSCSAEDADAYRKAYLELSTALILRDVGNVTTPLGSTDSEDLARSQELRAKLKDIELWFGSARQFLYPASGPDADLLARLNEVFKLFWNRAYLQGEMNKNVSSDAEAEAVRLGVLDHGTRAERQVLRAAFDVPSLCDAPMRGELLLPLMGDALHGIEQRLEEVSLLHDMSCRFQDCTGVRSQSRQLWGLLGSLHDSSLLGNELSAIGLVASDKRLDASWVKTFSFIKDRHDVLQAAINDTLGVGSRWDCSTAHSGYVPASLLSRSPESLRSTAVGFTSLLKTARARVAGYDSNALFVLSDARRLAMGLDAQKQVNINTRLDDSISELEGEIITYQGERLNLVKGLLAMLDNQRNVANLTTRTDLLYEQTIQLGKDLEGLRASHAVDQVRYGDFMKGFELLNVGVADSGREVIKAERTVKVSAQQAAYDGPGGATNLASLVVPDSTGATFKLEAQPGDVVNIQVSGQWSPTCALRQTVGFNGSKVLPVSPNLTPAMTGPEGFAVTSVEDNYYAEGVQTVTSEGTFTNVTGSVKACAGLELAKSLTALTGFFGLANLTASLEACGGFETGHTWSETESETNSHGSEARSSLALARGLRAKRTPFPDQPAGSLLLVRTRHQTGSPPSSIPKADILSVQVVRAPSTSVLVGEASDVYLVVNDMKSSVLCPTVDGSQLTLNVSHLQSEAEASKVVFRAMAAAEKVVRDNASIYVAQGRLLPSQATLLRSAAYQEVYNQCVRDHCASGNNLSSYSESLRNLFETWLAKDIVDIEREVELVNIERQMRALRMELAALEQDYSTAQEQSRLLALEPAWALRNLEGSELRERLRDLNHVMTDYIEPVVTLRHPEVRTGFTSADKAVLNKLVYFDPIRGSLVDLAREAKRVASLVNDKLKHERLVGPTQTINEVIISIPREKGFVSDYHQMDDDTAADIWADIKAGKDPLITLRPEHAYLLGGDSMVLGCTQSAPIINTMAFYLVHESATDYLPVNITTTIAPEMSFTTTPALRQYDFVRMDYLAPSVPLMLGFKEDVVTDLRNYWALPGTQVATGLSPFGTFHLNLLSFRRKYHNKDDGTIGDDNPFSFARELLIAFRVEPRQEAPMSKLPGVPECD